MRGCWWQTRSSLRRQVPDARVVDQASHVDGAGHNRIGRCPSETPVAVGDPLMAPSNDAGPAARLESDSEATGLRFSAAGLGVKEHESVKNRRGPPTDLIRFTRPGTRLSAERTSRNHR